MIYLLQALRGNKSYTDFIVGLIILSKYYKNYNKIIYASTDTYNLFENNRCTFHNIERNNAFKLLNHILPKKISRSDLDMKQLFAKRITRSSNINDMYANGFIHNTDNFLIDDYADYYYNKNYSIDAPFYKDNASKQIDSTSFKINLKIDIDDSIQQKFTADKYFISLPTWRLDDNIDIKILDIFISYLINETVYKDIILIGGSNYYKNYFYDKYGIITTHLYPNGFDGAVGRGKQRSKFLKKEKGSLLSILTDCLYIQESPASYIDFIAMYNTYRNDLQKFGLNKFADVYYDSFIQNSNSYAFDMICRELKFSKIFYTS